MDLYAKGAADVAADHAHVRFGDVEVPREDVLHHVRGLGGVMHRERVLAWVVVGEDRAAFEAHAGVAAEAVAFFEHYVGVGECGIHLAVVHVSAEADVVTQLRMDHDLARKGFVHVHDRGQRLPVGCDQFARVLGLRARLGHDRRNCFTLPACTVDCERILRRRLQALEVGEHPDPWGAVLGYCAAIDYGDNARRSARFRKIQALDPCVRVRAAQEHDVRKARETQIVDEGAAALQEALGIGARLGFADVACLRAGLRILDRQFVAGGHGLISLRRRASTVSIASTMAWYPVQRQ